MRAYKCDECGALAEMMPENENFLFRYQNGDRKIRIEMYFLRENIADSKELCLNCKIKFMKQCVEKLKKRREEEKNG